LAGDLGPAGYLVAYALAEANLRLGLTVVADSVNPLAMTRDAWRKVTAAANTAIFEIEVVCSNTDEHRRRVETRTIDIAGLTPPAWQEVINREYDPWDRPRLVIGTPIGRRLTRSTSSETGSTAAPVNMASGIKVQCRILADRVKSRIERIPARRVTR
jgi:hypothetical protein